MQNVENFRFLTPPSGYQIRVLLLYLRVMFLNEEKLEIRNYLHDIFYTQLCLSGRDVSV